MPCNCDHLEAHPIEITVGRVYLVLDEIVLGKTITPDMWEYAGYDDRSYGKANKALGDQLTERACSAFRKLTKTKIQKLSLEAQMWWRDHQEADRKAGR